MYYCGFNESSSDSNRNIPFAAIRYVNGHSPSQYGEFGPNYFVLQINLTKTHEH